MSLFGPIDDGDRRIWQQRNLLAVTEFVQLGVTEKLPPLRWTVPTSGTVTGTVDHHAGNHTGAHPREVFETWFVALSEHGRVDPCGLGVRGDLPPRRERTDDIGQTRMTAAFTLRFTDRPHPHCDIAIVAEWFEDDFEGDVARSTPAGAGCGQ